MKTKYNNSIGIRFSIRVFFISIVIAIFAIAIELYITFQENKSLARTSIQQVSESHIPALISSLWLTHSKLLQEQVDAITRFKYIAGVEVTDIDNNQFSAGEISNQDHSLITRDLLYEFREKKTLIGKLKLYIDDSQIMRDTFSREIPTFFLFFLQSLIVAIVIGLLFRGMVGRHLETFSQFLVKSRNDPNIERFNFNRKRTYHDELESLLQSFNINKAARIAAEEKIKENLKEKETLLQKIHQSEKKYREILEGLNDAAYRMSLPDGK